MVRFIGDELLACDESGRLRTRIATVFPSERTIVTLPGIHASQRCAFVDAVNEERRQRGEPPLTPVEEEQKWAESVDLVIDRDTILIRPDPDNMDLAFEADELLQEVVSKKKIKFLHVLDPRVRDAIRRRGERWRISPLPRSLEQIRQMIAQSRIGIGGREIYYYNSATGTRILTFQEFNSLSTLDDGQLRRHLDEIRVHSQQRNRNGSLEIEIFSARDSSIQHALQEPAFVDQCAVNVRAAFASMAKVFGDAVPVEFHRDDPQSPEWRGRMFAALIGHTDREVSEEALLGLAAEFFMQIEWLPGGRIEEGELLLDPVFEEEAEQNCPPGERLTDAAARGFIFNFIRDYGDLEYVNIGRVVGSLTSRLPSPGRRGVYLAEVKQRNEPHNILRILRMQKYGVREHLDQGQDLLTAVMEAEEYTEYILDRRLGCRQLGMNLSQRTMARKVVERYFGTAQRFHGIWLWSTYFERDYVSGVATDKIASWRLADNDFALRLARVLGRAAAPNLIVGRCDVHGKTIFDDGDELVVLDDRSMPVDIIVADHTGTFGEYRRDLLDLAGDYAEPIIKRRTSLRDCAAFGQAYATAFAERFSQIQQEYRKRRRAFDTLFKHLRRDPAGNLRYRWECVLKRLDSSEPQQLAERIRKGFEKAG